MKKETMNIEEIFKNLFDNYSTGEIADEFLIQGDSEDILKEINQEDIKDFLEWEGYMVFDDKECVKDYAIDELDLVKLDDFEEDEKSIKMRNDIYSLFDLNVACEQRNIKMIKKILNIGDL